MRQLVGQQESQAGRLPPCQGVERGRRRKMCQAYVVSHVRSVPSAARVRMSGCAGMQFSSRKADQKVK